ncbi:MAG: flagellar biosynthetic protein FliO [Nitrosomonas sp.]|nr:flagellar biosynthetic protein FliO [Nitrosomonas sp.]
MPKQFSAFLSFISLFIVSTRVFAETAQKTPIAPESIIGADSMTKMITGLLLVLVVILVSTWALKRFSIIPAISSSYLKIVAATGVGQRERVIIVEIGETWLVLGVAPGQVTKLHTLEKTSLEPENKTPKRAASEFSDALDSSIGKSKN